MATNYNKFIALLEKWPPNPSRVSRDYGYRLRELMKRCSQNGGNPFPGTTKDNERKLESLHRIADDYYNKKYSHNLTMGATGQTLKLLSSILDSKIKCKRKVQQQ